MCVLCSACCSVQIICFDVHHAVLQQIQTTNIIPQFGERFLAALLHQVQACAFPLAQDGTSMDGEGCGLKDKRWQHSGKKLLLSHILRAWTTICTTNWCQLRRPKHAGFMKYYLLDQMLRHRCAAASQAENGLHVPVSVRFLKGTQTTRWRGVGNAHSAPLVMSSPKSTGCW